MAGEDVLPPGAGRGRGGGGNGGNPQTPGNPNPQEPGAGRGRGAGGNAVKRKVTVPPEFKGTESAQRWFARFELCSRCNEWDKDTMFNQVLPLMSGDALDLILDKDPEDIPDYDSVKELLIKEYDNSELREKYVQEFKCRKLKDGEEYSAFMRSLKILAKKAYPNFDEEPRNALVADRYREEMPEKVRSVLSLLSIEAEDLDQLVSETRRLSKATDSHRSTLSVASLSTTTEDKGASGGGGYDAVLAKLEEIQSHISGLQVSQGDMEVRINNLYSRPSTAGRSRRPGQDYTDMKSNSGFGGSCWGCGGRGHVKKDCPRNDKGRDRSGGKFYPNIICNRCRNPGHYTSQCQMGNA